jgi:hypothetical protein
MAARHFRPDERAAGEFVSVAAALARVFQNALFVCVILSGNVLPQLNG